MRGEQGRAGGWFAHARRLLERDGSECVERGYLLLPTVVQGLVFHDPERACRALGDDDGARLEVGAARAAFERLGAAPDLARLDALAASAPSVLTPRERQVLRLVARGQTNKAIAAALSLSERTIERHLSNTFTKLQLSNRAAATAWAYEHGIV